MLVTNVNSPSHTDGDEHDDANDKKKDVKENEKAKPKVKAPSKNEDKTNNNNNKKMKKDTIEEIASPKETKPSKKVCNIFFLLNIIT